MKSRRFWGFTALAIVGMAITGSLGLWQLGRAHQKEALTQAVLSRQSMPPLTGADLVAGDRRASMHRPVLLRGRWMAEHTVYLDNRQMASRVGFYVATPLRLAGSDAAVLVQRGWVPRNFVDRQSLPPVETPTGEVQVAGRMAPPPAKLYQLGPAGTGAIRQNLELAPFAAETRLPLLLDVTVQQTGPASQGLLRDWPETSAWAGRGPETNYGYAFQWWALSALIAILYAWFQFIQPRRQAR